MSRTLVLTALLGLLLTVDAGAEQPSGGDYVITRSTIDGGGGMSAGGDYVLTGTIGQPDASAQSEGGEGYAVAGGFWAYLMEVLGDLIFRDGFE
jgi:hypothetical protein